MDSLPPPTSSSPATPEQSASAESRSRSRFPPGSGQPAELHLPTADDLLAILHEALADPTRRPEAILCATADAARVVTAADGIALALRNPSNAFVCCARSGSIGPEIGAPLGAESGISGVCLRTATVQRCDDTQIDGRVDPDVCRVLGIRSIAAVPLLDPSGTIGILVAFSLRAGNFAETQIGVLQQMGEVAEAAYRRPLPATQTVPPAPIPHGPTQPENNAHALNRQPAAHAAANEALIGDAPEELIAKNKPPYWILAAALALLMLAAGVVWWTWHTPPGELGSSQSSVEAHSLDETSSSATAPGTVPDLTIRVANAKPDPAHKNVLQNAAKLESENSKPNSAAVAVAHADNTIAAARPSPPPSLPAARTIPASSADPPVVVLGSSTSDESLSQIASAPASLPSLEVRVSEGVTPANVIRKVNPVYPKDALSRGLSGSVVLNISIATDGTVQDVKLVRGEQVFAGAAEAAVRQWRYSPALLDGKPVAVQKEITLIFKP